MHSETALALVTRKHVNHREQWAADPDRTREFCLSQGGDSFEFIPLLFPCYSPVTADEVPLFGWNSMPVRSPENAVFSDFPSVRLPDASRQALIGYAFPG